MSTVSSELNLQVMVLFECKKEHVQIHNSNIKQGSYKYRIIWSHYDIMGPMNLGQKQKKSNLELQD